MAKQRTAVVTGGMGGLGETISTKMAGAGYRVLVTYSPSNTKYRSWLEEMKGRGFNFAAFPVDVVDYDDCARVCSRIQSEVGPIDILVNNASTLGPTPLRLLLDTECEDLTRVLEVNLVGPFRLTKVIAGSMALRGRGLVVNISSDASIEAYPTWGAYSISKAALDHLTRIWAVELAEAGVRFLAIDPGEMNTRMHADAIPEADPASLADPAEVAARIAALMASAQPSTGARIQAEAGVVAS